jgi:hypothetical protein
MLSKSFAMHKTFVEQINMICSIFKIMTLKISYKIFAFKFF